MPAADHEEREPSQRAEAGGRGRLATWIDHLASRLPRSARYEFFYARMRSPKCRGSVNLLPAAEPAMLDVLRGYGLPIRDLVVQPSEYRSYIEAAGYRERYPVYYPNHFPEKSLEHFIAAKLLELGPDDVYIDVASEESPVPEIYQRLFGCRTYAQDLSYPRGVAGRRIGGDAAAMPLPEGFATKMALHCSFEHFEGDSDRGFISECGRVLAPDGAVAIVPLYLNSCYAIQTDPAVAGPGGVHFERDAVLHCARRWRNRHGRFYDSEHLYHRLVRDQAHRLRFEVVRMVNLEGIHPSCYARFALVIRKPNA